jgi:hypothetical protein
MTRDDHEDLFFADAVASYVDAPRFFRRDWLARRIQAGLATDKQLLLLVAPPGAGKSGLIAQLAADHAGWPRFFIRRDQRTVIGETGARSFLLRVGFQLAAIHPQLFDREQVRIDVEQTVGEVADGGQAVGARIGRVLASPFHETVMRIKQQVAKSSGAIAGIEIRNLVSHPRLLQDDDLEDMALFAPARTLRRLQPSTQLVILVDALDELDSHGAERTLLHWLTHCPKLPSNVRFVLTSREHAPSLRLLQEKQSDNIMRLAIPAGDALVRAELRAYATRLSAEPAVSATLMGLAAEQARNPGGRAPTALGSMGPVERFAEELATRADGNIGYMAALARAIDHEFQPSSSRSKVLAKLLAMSELPRSTTELYAFFLHQLENNHGRGDVQVTLGDYRRPAFLNAWSALFHPILAVLCVAYEPLDHDQIRCLSGTLAGEIDVVRALDVLGQFLQPVGARYRFWHRSFSDFLTDPATAANPDTRGSFVNSVDAHARIVARYIGENRSLSDVDWPAIDDLYPFVHLAKHVRLAHAPSRRHSGLYDLMSRSFVSEKLARTDYPSVAEDAMLCAATAAAEEPPNIVQVLRHSVLYGRLHSAMRKLAPELLGLLTLVGQGQRAMAYALMATPPRAVEGLVFVARAHHRLREDGDARSVLRRALGLLEGIEVDADQNLTLFEQVVAELAKLGDGAILSDFIRLVARARPCWQTTRVLEAAVSACSRISCRSGLQEIWGIVKGAGDAAAGGQSFGLALQLVSASWSLGETTLARDAAFYASTRMHTHAGNALRVVRMLCELGNVEGAGQLLREQRASALCMARAIPSDEQRGSAILAVATALARSGRGRLASVLVNHVSAMMRNMRSEDGRDRLTVDLAATWVAMGELGRAVASVQGAAPSPQRNRQLYSLVQNLADAGQSEQALRTALRFEEAKDRCGALAALTVRDRTPADSAALRAALSSAVSVLLESSQRDSWVMVAAGRALGRLGDVSLAVRSLDGTWYSADAAEALGESAAFLAGIGDTRGLERLLDTGQALNDTEHRARIVWHVALSAIGAGMLEAIRGRVQPLLRKALTVESDFEEARALGWLLEAVVRCGQVEPARELAALTQSRLVADIVDMRAVVCLAASVGVDGATARAKEMADGSFKSRAFLELAELCQRKGLRSQSLALCHLAYSSIDLERDTWDAVHLLERLGKLLLDVQDRELSNSVSKDLMSLTERERHTRNAALRAAAGLALGWGAVASAFGFARSLGHVGHEGQASASQFGAVAEERARKADLGTLRAALRAAEHLEDSWYRANVISHLCRAMITIGHSGFAKQRLQALRREVRDLSTAIHAHSNPQNDPHSRIMAAEVEQDRVAALASLATALDRAGEPLAASEVIDEALEAAAKIHDGMNRANALQELALASKPSQGIYAQVRSAAQTLRRADDRDRVLALVAQLFGHAKAIDEVDATVALIHSAEYVAAAYNGLASHAARSVETYDTARQRWAKCVVEASRGGYSLLLEQLHADTSVLELWSPLELATIVKGIVEVRAWWPIDREL